MPTHVPVVAVGVAEDRVSPSAERGSLSFADLCLSTGVSSEHADGEHRHATPGTMWVGVGTLRGVGLNECWFQLALAGLSSVGRLQVVLARTWDDVGRRRDRLTEPTPFGGQCPSPLGPIAT